MRQRETERKTAPEDMEITEGTEKNSKQTLPLINVHGESTKMKNLEDERVLSRNFDI